MKLYKFYYNEHAYISSIPVAWMKARPMVKGQNTVYKIYRSLAYSMIILITVQVKLWFFSQICRTEFTFVMCHENTKYENAGYSEWIDGGKTLVYKWISIFILPLILKFRFSTHETDFYYPLIRSTIKLRTLFTYKYMRISVTTYTDCELVYTKSHAC